MNHAVTASIPATHPQQEFLDDMKDFFGGWRQGHIARHGYVGEGGNIYGQWLVSNDAYRSRVTLAEVELIASFASAITETCHGCRHFVEAGPGSFKAFLMKTHAVLARIAAKNPDVRYTIADVSRAAYQDVAQNAEHYGLPHPDFAEGNFFAVLPPLEPSSTVYIPGLTFTNIYEDALRRDTKDILTDTLRFFAKSLHQGGTLIFSYATSDGIDAQGTQIKAFYDDPLIHAYQQSIFKRVQNELPVVGDFDPTAFAIHHEWRPDRMVLTRHATLARPLSFDLDGHKYDLKPETFDGYMANNFRPDDAMMTQAIRAAGFAGSRIFSLPHSNIRLISCNVA